MQKLKLKSAIITYIFFAFTISTKAQLIPAFEMPFYFEDALGNLDTIIIGLDERASFEKLDSLFGEVALNKPFDSIFDVRLRIRNGFSGDFTKRDIRRYEIVDACNGKLMHSYAQFFLIHAKHPPVKMYYNSSKLNDALCRPKGALLLPNNSVYHFISPFEVTELDEQYYRCLSTTDTILIEFDKIPNFYDNYGGIPVELNNETTERLPFFQFVFGRDNYEFLGLDIRFCEDVMINTTAIEEDYIKLFPIPVKNKLYVSGLLESQIGALLQIYTTNGQLVYENEMRNATEILQLNYLPDGQYLVTLFKNGKLISTNKFIKID